MTTYFVIAAYLLLVAYAFLQHYEILVAKRINDFYIITYGLPRPVVGLRMRRSLRKQKLSTEEVQRRLSRCTSFLCLQVPPGSYRAVTHDRVIEGLLHMEQRGRATVESYETKGKPKRQRKLIRHVFGRHYDGSAYDEVQEYKVMFTIDRRN